MAWLVDLITGTGMRAHEVFAILLDDIDLDATDPYLYEAVTLVTPVWRRLAGGRFPAAVWGR